MSMEMHSSVQYLFCPTYKPFYISFSAFFSASFVEMFARDSQIESRMDGVTNRVRKSQLESYVSQLESDMVRHREQESPANAVPRLSANCYKAEIN